MVDNNQLARLVRKATGFARVGVMGKPHELWTLIIVGLGAWKWVQHGLVPREEVEKFEEAVLAAGMELGLAPATVNLDEAAVAAKRAAATRAERPGRSATRAGPGPGPGDDEGEARLRARLAGLGVAQQLIEAEVRRRRARRAREAAAGAG